MPSVLISGPAGSGKSTLARELLEAEAGPAIMVDFQSLVAAVTGVVRGPDGRYPLRNPALLPLVEYVRRAALTAARQRDIVTVATNSDGDPGRREFLLAELGEGATERVVDPGREVVSARLADAVTGTLSPACSGAINRWYGRL